MRVAAVTGLSGSGKTTLMEALIRLYVARGVQVAAIKHTHHSLPDALTEADRGDTARFANAGADPVVLAGESEAIVYPTRARLRYELPVDLLDQAAPEGVVLVEGFKHCDRWPRLELVHGQWRDPRQVSELLDDLWSQGPAR